MPLPQAWRAARVVRLPLSNAMHPSIKDLWRCDECGELHGDEEDAAECCRPNITAGYGCPVCGAFCLSENEAIDCCDFDPDGPPPPPIAAELEAAGQMRLIP